MTRKLPLLTQETTPFWQGGEQGQLNICFCRGCQRYFHPPALLCPQCLSFEVGPRPVSGKGTVVSFTVNHQAWVPGLPVPYVVAIVELAEQPGLRFVSNIVGGERIGHSTARAEVSRPGTGFKPRENPGLAARVAGSL